MVNSKQRRRRQSENVKGAVNSRKFHLTLTEKANRNKDLIKTQYAIKQIFSNGDDPTRQTGRQQNSYRRETRQNFLRSRSLSIIQHIRHCFV